MKTQTKTSCPGNILVLALILAGALTWTSHAQTTPAFLADAEALVEDLLQSELTSSTWPNTYGSPAYINWNGPESSARTDCSSFITKLWGHTYGWDRSFFYAWMGDPHPNALGYHNAIQQQNGFACLRRVSDIEPGDIIAIAYYPENSVPSGHVAIVQDFPQPNSSKPFVPGTYQWTVSVIDSTATYHGKTDTRYSHPGGIGQGVFRLYSDSNGVVVGHTWSLLGTSLSSYYPQSSSTSSGRHLVIGRLRL